MKPSRRDVMTLVWLSALTVLGVVSAWERWPGRGTRAIEELTVHRLNVIEADGKPRLIISDAAHFPGAIYGGREYRHPDRESNPLVGRGGILFYNDDGDEVGGLMFKTGLLDGSRYADSSLKFDQYRQNESMQLEYGYWKGIHDAGLRVWDQPNESLLPVLEQLDRAARATTKDEHDAIIKQLNAAKNKAAFTERFYAGKRSNDSIVQLADKNGKPRLILKVTPDGRASVEFLNAAGKVTKSIVP